MRVAGDGEYATEPFVPRTAGFYTFREWIRAGSFLRAAETPCGEVAETTVVTAQPSLATVTRTERTAGGTAVSDSVADISQPLVRGKLELRTDISRAFYDGKRVDLTLTEFNIVRLLAGAVDADVSYRQIYDLVRGKDFVAGYGEEGFRVNVRSFIKRIRQKFREVDEEFDCIGNYPGFGYRWMDPA